MRVPFALLLALGLLVPLAQAQGSASAPAAFEVTGNGDLDADHGVTSGSGTAADPYILVVPPEARRLHVKDTTAHVVIRDAEFKPSREGQVEFFGTALVLDNVKDVRVEGASVTTFNHGIDVLQSQNVTIEGASARSQVYFGLHIELSQHVRVLNSTFNRTQGAGVSVEGSRDILLEGNAFHEAGRTGAKLSASIHVTGSRDVRVIDNLIGASASDALYFDEVDRYELRGNRVEGHGSGLWVNQSTRGVITGNEVRGNRAAGIYLCHGNDHVVAGNTMVDNSLGMDLTDIVGAVLSNNTFESSHTYALALNRADATQASGNHFGNHTSGQMVVRVDGSHNRFTNNTLFGNTGQHIRVVAGEDNTWDGQLLPLEPEPLISTTDDGPEGRGRGSPGPGASLVLVAVGLAALALTARRR